MPISPAAPARAALALAVALALPASWALAYRASVPCWGSFRHVRPLTDIAADALPIIAEAVPIGEVTRSPGFDTSNHYEGAYSLGGFRARYAYDSDRGRPAPISFDIDHPGSCDGASIAFLTDMYADRRSLKLRQAPNGPFVITISQPSYDPTNPRNRAFYVDPPGRFRRLPRVWISLVVLLISALTILVAHLRARRAHAYFGPRGIATWETGHIDERGWVVPASGALPVQASRADLAPGTEVVFSQKPATRSWTFRQTANPTAISILPGSHADLATLHTHAAMDALFAAILGAVMAGGVLVAMVW